jgi:aspartyl-tRNA(Asn)/glutamyl-tRNA(Gln) amidotransferase subunit A
MAENSYYLGISELSKLIREQTVSPVEIVETCLKRIEELNPKLNAFITVLTNQALEQAKRAESEIKAGNWRGPLHGIPVGIKDFYDTAGVKTTAAFEHFKNRVPNNDAKGVAKLKETAAIIIGKTNMHTLGMGTTGLESYFGPVKNPWNSESIPGGSSSGSAAAVASGLCYATLDTDAIGSCRLPAACCGVVGFKGTYGSIGMKGILEGEEPPDEMIQWLSHAGITTRSVEDTALVLDVLVERNEHTKTANFFGDLAKDRKLRIGIANNFRADDEVSAAFEKAVEKIRSLGYSMSKVAAPFGDPSQGIGNIEADRKAIARQTFKDIDVLLLPTIPTTTPSVKDAGKNQQALSPEHTVFANYYGLPAVSVPCGFDKRGLPLGLQIVGKPWGEGAVLQLAHQYQMATDYRKEHPIE